MSVDVKTVVLKTLTFVVNLAEESSCIQELKKEIKKYKAKMEKQEYLAILEQLDNL